MKFLGQSILRKNRFSLQALSLSQKDVQHYMKNFIAILFSALEQTNEKKTRDIF